MFKKLALSTVIAISSLHAGSAKAADEQNLHDKLKMKAFLCVYWECPAMFMQATGLNALLEHLGQEKDKQTIDTVSTATGDARFFADRVKMTEPGEIATDLYRRVVVKLEPGDVITSIDRINDSSGYHYGEVPMNVEGLQVLDLKNGEGAGVKINGRPLISKDLKAAHAATQNLIFDGVIKAPQNEFNTATNAVLLNEKMLDFANGK